VTDDEQWEIAGEVEQEHQNWAVMWGCYTRLFWAFPLFEVPKGTIVSARDADRLLLDMEQVETEHGVPARQLRSTGVSRPAGRVN
jgi:hypothetical protein